MPESGHDIFTSSSHHLLGDINRKVYIAVTILDIINLV
jgi:hypothetical protein